MNKGIIFSWDLAMFMKVVTPSTKNELTEILSFLCPLVFLDKILKQKFIWIILMNSVFVRASVLLHWCKKNRMIIFQNKLT